MIRDQLTAIVRRLKDELLQLPQAEDIAIQSIREVSGLYARLNQLRPTDQVVAEDYLQVLKEEWYAEWLYDGDTLEQRSLEHFQSESIRLLNEFPLNPRIAAFRAELLLDLAIESGNRGEVRQADQEREQVHELLAQLRIGHPDSLPVRTLIWKAAGQKYQAARQQQLAEAQLVPMAQNLVVAQQAVIDLTPEAERS